MNLRNIFASFVIITLLMFITGIKIVSAEILTQPVIGSSVSINVGTDRIMDIMQSDAEEELSKPPPEIATPKITKSIEDQSTIVETFHPSSKIETNNETIHQKDEYSKQKTDINEDIDIKNTSDTKVLVSVSGGTLRTDTGGNGEMKNKISGADIVFVRELKTETSKLSIGGVIDYSHSKYDNNFDDLSGDGKTRALTAGIIAREQKDTGVYYEGSVRIGRAKTDFSSDNLTINDEPTHVDYEVSAPIYAGHVKIGKIIGIDKKNDTDIYGTYAFSHQDHKNVTLSTGEDYQLSSANSNRIRIGCRMTKKTHDGKIYYGMAYQYERNSDVNAKYNGTKVDISNAQGSSAVIELGYRVKANKNATLNVDLNATGFAGHQKGFIIQTQLIKLF